MHDDIGKRHVQNIYTNLLVIWLINLWNFGEIITPILANYMYIVDSSQKKWIINIHY